MRARRIDILKGILTIQMILAHCIQFYVDFGKDRTALLISEYINLTTFSGFLFCFGYASCLAYFSKEWREASGRLMKNVLRLLAGYYLSGFCYVIFVEKIPLRLDLVLEILLFGRLAKWSEFLFSFALIMLLECIFFPLFTGKYKWSLPALTIISVLTCLLSYREAGSIVIGNASGASIIGSLIGGTGGTYFPVIPYSLYFLAGIWFARRQFGFKKSILAIACIGTIWHTIDYVWISGQQPSRFPLSFSYLVGAAFYIYLYYLIATAMEKREETRIVCYLGNVGRSSLFYLLLSNLIIFAVTATKFYKREMNYSIGLFLVTLMVIGYLQRLCREKRLPEKKIKRNEKRGVTCRNHCH